MKISQRDSDLIKSFEGLRLKAYLCPASVWTIGYGSTGPHVRQGVFITEVKAEALLRQDLARFERGVEAMAGPCTQGQYEALISFAFNVGISALQASTLLKRHKEGAHEQAADQFLRWNKAGKLVLPGLTRRRAAERKLYLS
ncbi:MAG: lysozyme [Sphingosinicella sp.]|nr:lysozyme [Sphingosinicella sp.]